VVQIAIGECRQLECPEADIKGLIIDTESLVFDKLMDEEGCVVGLLVGHVHVALSNGLTFDTAEVDRFFFRVVLYDLDN
jgi:hypothetical protein